MIQCKDNKADRELGYYWERQFCIMAYNYGKCFTPHQWNRDASAVAFDNIKSYTLPDITIWTCPGEHHEIKHKNPTKKNSFGLEKYRYDSLVKFADIVKQDVLYTIHNHDFSGGRNSKTNNKDHWLTARVGVDIILENAYKSWGNSYVSGKSKNVEILYWNMNLFMKLIDYWKN